MAFGYKSKYKRKFARKGRVAKIAAGKSTKVQALAKAVSRIQRRMRITKEYLNYGQQASFSLDGTGLTALNMSAFSGWSRIFGTSSNDDTDNKVIHKSTGIDMYVTLENPPNTESDTTQFTCFLVSLKDIIGPAFNPSNGVLSLSTGVHFQVQGGMVLLNKSCFKIHKMKRFVLSNHGTTLSNPSAQTQSGTDKRWYWKFSPNAMIHNPSGDWKALSSANDPSKCYYVLIFHDNLSIDLQNPKVDFNAVHTVATVA